MRWQSVSASLSESWAEVKQASRTSLQHAGSMSALRAGRQKKVAMARYEFCELMPTKGIIEALG